MSRRRFERIYGESMVNVDCQLSIVNTSTLISLMRYITINREYAVCLIALLRSMPFGEYY